MYRSIVNIFRYSSCKVSKDHAHLCHQKCKVKLTPSVEFDQVLVADDNVTVMVGAPLLDGAKVSRKNS